MLTRLRQTHFRQSGGYTRQSARAAFDLVATAPVEQSPPLPPQLLSPRNSNNHHQQQQQQPIGHHLSASNSSSQLLVQQSPSSSSLARKRASGQQQQQGASQPRLDDPLSCQDRQLSAANSTAFPLSLHHHHHHHHQSSSLAASSGPTSHQQHNGNQLTNRLYIYLSLSLSLSQLALNSRYAPLISPRFPLANQNNSRRTQIATNTPLQTPSRNFA